MRLHGKILVGLLLLIQVGSIEAQQIRLKAQNGVLSAQYDLGQQYYTGVGEIQNKAQALVWFEKAAKRNHALAAWMTGSMYEKGEACSQDLRKAFNYYLVAAEKNHFQSQQKVATMLEEGIGVPENLRRAYLWYRIIAETGDAVACRKLGDFYSQGNVVEKNNQEAEIWYNRAIEKGDVEAMMALGVLYTTGDCLAPDYQKAFALLSKPAAQGYPQAQYTIGKMIETNHLDSDLSFFDLYTSAAQANFGPAKARIGYCYYIGQTVPTDKKKAFAWMSKAEKITDADVLCALATMYAEGSETEVNLVKAVQLFQKAAGAFNPEAQYRLGELYEKGQGVKQDMQEAQNWYELSAREGYLPAKEKIKSLENR